jgi:hypothetical protein
MPAAIPFDRPLGRSRLAVEAKPFPRQAKASSILILGTLVSALKD